MSSWPLLSASIVALQTISPSTDARCLTCHGMRNLAIREPGGIALRDFSVPADRYKTSVHGRLGCVQCHDDVGEYPHQFGSGRPKITCSKDCHAVDASGRPYSHQSIAGEFADSVHGRSDPLQAGGRPTCLSCHGSGDPHAIPPARQNTPTLRMAACVGCHDDRSLMQRHRAPTDAVSSYRRSFHYKAIRFGESGTAVCQDCHGAHRVLSAGDPRSSVAAANLPRTCGQTNCHTGARMNFAMSGANHLDRRIAREPMLVAEETLFFLLTAGTMAMLVAGIALDVQKKFGWYALAGRAGARLRVSGRTACDGIRRAARTARWLLME